ncbi:hypothetical protein EJ06DRAFT_192021 [Trichodelitschia bisporula]|uniref:Uncharacterized protein n=1 Tax=Trichodelitschia bisporula TaxID=703511 RepID=A0A6G1I857_9PEZI|nr:hypothetical protein EJ06DRAFT_192021 [Trichodelitschia bisporula]
MHPEHPPNARHAQSRPHKRLPAPCIHAGDVVWRVKSRPGKCSRDGRGCMAAELRRSPCATYEANAFLASPVPRGLAPARNVFRDELSSPVCRIPQRSLHRPTPPRRYQSLSTFTLAVVRPLPPDPDPGFWLRSRVVPHANSPATPRAPPRAHDIAFYNQALAQHQNHAAGPATPLRTASRCRDPHAGMLGRKRG